MATNIFNQPAIGWPILWRLMWLPLLSYPSCGLFSQGCRTEEMAEARAERMKQENSLFHRLLVEARAKRHGTEVLEVRCSVCGWRASSFTGECPHIHSHLKKVVQRTSFNKGGIFGWMSNLISTFLWKKVVLFYSLFWPHSHSGSSKSLQPW